MSKLDQIKSLLAAAVGLTEQQTATMADGDWLALRDRLVEFDPPDSELRSCLMFAKAIGRMCAIEAYDACEQHSREQRHRREIENRFAVANKEKDRRGGQVSSLVAEKKELETQLAEARQAALPCSAAQRHAVESQALIREGIESPGEVLAYAAAKATAETAMQELNRRYVPHPELNSEEAQLAESRHADQIPGMVLEELPSGEAPRAFKSVDIAACAERVRRVAEAYMDTVFAKMAEANKVPPGMVNNTAPECVETPLQELKRLATPKVVVRTPDPSNPRRLNVDVTVQLSGRIHRPDPTALVCFQCRHYHPAFTPCISGDGG